MVKILKRKGCHEATNDEFYVTLTFLLDTIKGKTDISNMNLQGFRDYCVEAGHFYVAAQILDNYLEQLDTKKHEFMCDMTNVRRCNLCFLSIYITSTVA